MIEQTNSAGEPNPSETSDGTAEISHGTHGVTAPVQAASTLYPTFPGEVESVNITPVESADERASDNSSVQVNLQTSGLAFQVQTQVPQSTMIIELNAKIEILAQQLVATQAKLEDALRRVGFLEAQVLQRDQVIDQLCKNQTD